MNKIFTKVIRVPAKEYDEYQKYLSFGEEIPGVDRDGIASVYTARFMNGYEMDIKVCNAETEGGGAYIDPVLFDTKGTELACAEVGDSLDTQYNIMYNGDEYQTIIVKGL